MTEDKKVDSKPEKSTSSDPMPDNAKVHKPEAKVKTVKPSRGGSAIAVSLAVVAIVIAGYGLYEIKQTPLKQIEQNFQTQATLEKAQQSQITQLKTELDKANAKIATFSNQSEQVKSAFNSSLGSYQGKLNALTQRINLVQNNYLLPQNILSQQIDAVNTNAAMLYLNLASQYILITSNFGAAAGLVQSAQNALTPLGGVGKTALYQTRKALGVIQTQRELNSGQVLSKISSLLSQADQLEMIKPGNAVTVKTKSKTIQSNSISDSMAASWDRLKSLVTIEDLSDTDTALIEKRTRSEIQYSLHVYLQQAQIAAFQNYGRLFEQNLSEAKKLVKTYFVSNAKRKSWLKTANELQLINPDASVKALDQALQSVSAIDFNHVVQQTQTQSIEQPKGVTKGDK